MTFDIKQHITENNDTLNEARGMSVIAMGNLVDKLRDSETHLHKVQHWAKKDHEDPSIDQMVKSLIGKLRAVRLEADRLEAQLERSQY